MRCHPLDKEQFIHLLETRPHFYQGLAYNSGYMVETLGDGATVDTEFEDLDLLYKMYKSFFTSRVRLLKHHPLYYLEVEYTDSLLMMNLSQYYTNQADALEAAKLRGLSYVFSVHANEHIHMKG